MDLAESDPDEGFDEPDLEEGQVFWPSWRPGENCGDFVCGRRAFGVQAQVLICNVYLNMRQLPAKLAKEVLLCLPPGCDVARNFADRLSSRILGLAHSTARAVHDRLAGSGWRPIDEALRDSSTPSASLTLSEFEALKFRVREAMGVCHDGRPDTDYARAMRRVTLCGLEVGDKWLSRSFAEPVEMLAAAAARAEAAANLNAIYPSLGVPSDIALVWDGVSIGARSFSR
jgi:hypothetical protein